MESNEIFAMSQPTRFWALKSVALALAVACAAEPNDAGENMRAAILDANRENDRHADACTAASLMEDLMTEASQHEDSMGSILLRMNQSRDHMRMGSMMSMHCSGPSFEQMSDSLSEMHAELASHADRMREALSVGDAQDECIAHTDVTRDMMRSMHDDLERMPCMQR